MSDALIDVTERLYRDFQPHVSRPDIVELVRRCCTELDIAPTGALPELVERLARHRLIEQSAEVIQTPAFSARASVTGSQCCLILRGEVDLEVSGAVIDAARCHLTDPRVQSLVIDLDAVTFMDSTALGALVAIRNTAREMGMTIALRNIPDGIKRLLVITGLDGVFAVNPNSGPSATPDAEQATSNGNY